MGMAMAAATNVIQVPFRALETVSDGRGRQFRLSPLALRGDNNVLQPFTSLHLPFSTQNFTPFRVVSCFPSSRLSKTLSNPSTKLFVSGLSFRTTEESLRKAFRDFGQLLEVKLVMDKIANRPKGFAFIRYVTEEESQKAIEGMHGKFLDGRVIFVEVAKSRSELPQSVKQNLGQT